MTSTCVPTRPAAWSPGAGPRRCRTPPPSWTTRSSRSRARWRSPGSPPRSSASSTAPTTATSRPSARSTSSGRRYPQTTRHDLPAPRPAWRNGVAGTDAGHSVVLALSPLPLALHVLQHREDSSVLRRTGAQLELVEDARAVLLHGGVAHIEGCRDAVVRLALGHRGEHVELTRAEAVERPAATAPPEHPPHDLGVE